MRQEQDSLIEEYFKNLFEVERKQKTRRFQNSTIMKLTLFCLFIVFSLQKRIVI